MEHPKSEKENSPKYGLTNAQFTKYGTELLDYYVNYTEKTVLEHRPYPDVQPGFLKGLLPAEAPEVPDNWEHIMEDVDNIIMKGVSLLIYLVALLTSILIPS